MSFSKFPALDPTSVNYRELKSAISVYGSTHLTSSVQMLIILLMCANIMHTYTHTIAGH